MAVDVTLRVNGVTETRQVPDRLTLADYLREALGLTGTHLGCEQGACGACTVLLDGHSVRSCLVLAGQADGCAVLTVEGLDETGQVGRELRSAFARHDAVQCGFCTPGLLMASLELLAEKNLNESTVRSALSGNLCRCTGYDGIVRAVLDVHERLGPVTVPPELLAPPTPLPTSSPTPTTRHSSATTVPPTAAQTDAATTLTGGIGRPDARLLLLAGIAAAAGLVGFVLAARRRRAGRCWRVNVHK